MPEQDISSLLTDDLSPFAQQVLRINLHQAYASLVPGGGGPPEARDMLESASSEQMLTGEIRSRDDARAMIAGLWLWHDFLDDSHQISQQLHSSTGSFWHAIMHRREGDFSNSQYWYARCRNHPVIATLGMQAAALVNPMPASKLLLRIVDNGWNADAFVDLVEQVHDLPDDPLYKPAVSLQQLEWRLLFDHCTRAAAGK